MKRKLILIALGIFLTIPISYSRSTLLDNELMAPNRTIKIIPIDTPSGNASNVNVAPNLYGGVPVEFTKIGACTLGFGRKIQFVNVSPIPQTIKVKTTNAKMVVQTCGSEYLTPFFFLSGQWTQINAYPCWNFTIDYPTSFPDEVTINLGAMGTSTDKADAHFHFQCEVKRSGYNISRCTYAFGSPILNSTPDLLNNTVAKAVATQDISVMESEGAVIANLTGGPDSGCVEFDNATRFNIPINGGRAF